MIAVDWGTSNFRAFRISAGGVVVEKRFSAQGILRVEQGNFEGVLRAEVGAWLAGGETHILLCGMAGSRQGWVEVEYLPCPAGVTELANAIALVPFRGANVGLVPGVMAPDAGPHTAGVPELMRGEETAAMGILDACDGTGLICLPGTHSKWIQLSERKIAGFTTSMTGEVYDSLRKCTILGRTMTDGSAVDQAAFSEGVTRSADAGGLLHHLFGVRTLTLRGKLREDASASYLSGLLLGHEVRASMPQGLTVHLVGANTLCRLYAQAIQACGGATTIEAEDAAALGLVAIGRRLGWI